MTKVIAAGLSSKLTTAEKTAVRTAMDFDKGVRDYATSLDAIFSKAVLDLDFAKNNLRVYEPYGLTSKVLTDAVTTVRATTATYDTPTGIASAANNIPRIEYDTVTGQCLGLLAEESRTNLLLRSQEFDNASWTKQAGATITPNTTTAPDGTLTADTLTTNNGVSAHQSATATSGTTYCQSVYIKAGTITRVMVRDDTGAGRHIVINPATGAVTSTSGTLVAHGVDTQPNGWFRAWFSYVADTTAVRMNIRSDAENSATVMLWGAQIEVGSFPTSYISTITAQVTRNADVISRALPVTNVNAGAIFIEFDLTSYDTSSPNATVIAKLCDSANTNNRGFGLNLSGNQFALRLRDSVISNSVSITVSNSLLPKKALISFDLTAGQMLITIDGLSSSASITAGIDLSLFVSHLFVHGGTAMTGSTIQHSKTVKRCAYFPRSFTAAEAQAITA